MQRKINRTLLLLVWLGAAWIQSPAQSAKTIVIRVMDGHSGERITPDNIDIRLDRKKASRIDLVKVNDDGTTEVKIPDGTTSVSVRATYANSMDYYINCDVSKQKDTTTETWFPVADVLTQGLVIPNECATAKEAAKIKIDAKPGEFVLLVRKRGWKEQWVQQ